MNGPGQGIYGDSISLRLSSRSHNKPTSEPTTWSGRQTEAANELLLLAGHEIYKLFFIHFKAIKIFYSSVQVQPGTRTDALSH